MPPSSKPSSRSEVAAGAIVFTIQNKAIYVLQLVKNPAYRGRESDEEAVDIGPKGHLERGESVLQAAHREIREELGIAVHLDTGFVGEQSYVFEEAEPKTGKRIRVSKKVTYFLAFIHSKDIKQIAISEEHKRCFLMPIGKAIEKAKYENQKQLLQNAKEYIAARYLT